MKLKKILLNRSGRGNQKRENDRGKVRSANKDISFNVKSYCNVRAKKCVAKERE
jgi:hypothetical protein